MSKTKIESKCCDCKYYLPDPDTGEMFCAFSDTVSDKLIRRHHTKELIKINKYDLDKVGVSKYTEDYCKLADKVTPIIHNWIGSPEQKNECSTFTNKGIPRR